MNKVQLKCSSPLFADIYRDGGSYGFGFYADDGNVYELHIRVVSDSPDDCKRYYEPIIFRDNSNSEKIVSHLTWKEASKFMKDVKFENQRYQQLKRIINDGGWRLPKNN